MDGREGKNEKGEKTETDEGRAERGLYTPELQHCLVPFLQNQYLG